MSAPEKNLGFSGFEKRHKLRAKSRDEVKFSWMSKSFYILVKVSYEWKFCELKNSHFRPKISKCVDVFSLECTYSQM